MKKIQLTFFAVLFSFAAYSQTGLYLGGEAGINWDRFFYINSRGYSFGQYTFNGNWGGYLGYKLKHYTIETGFYGCSLALPDIYIDYDTSLLFAPKTYKISAVDSLKGESLLSDSVVSGYLYISPSTSAHTQLNYHHFLGQTIHNSLPLYHTDSTSYNLPFDSLSINDTSFIDQYLWASACHNYLAASVLSQPIHISGYGIMDTLKSNPATNCLLNLLHPSADFYANVPLGSLPTVVGFFDISKTAIKDWLWDFGDGTTSNLQHPSHAYNTGGYYTVSLTVSNCYGLSNIVKTGFIYVGLNSAIEKSNLKLYPNPTKDYIYIELSSKHQIVSVKLYNLMGELISSNENILQSNYRLNLSDKAKGIYFIEVVTDLGIVNRKIVID